MMMQKITAALQQRLLASVAIILLLKCLDVSGAPRRTCYLPKMPENREAFRTIRNKYEDLRFNGVAPWQNCSEKFLRRPKLDTLTKWEKLEAMELELNLVIPVLQNQSKPTFAKETSQVLEFLLPYREDLTVCMQSKPSHPKDSGKLAEFKEGLQKFNTSNAEQFPQCLEAAVGLNIYSLLQDISQISHHHHHHGQHHGHHDSRPAN